MNDTLKEFYSIVNENSKRQMEHADRYLGLAESDASERKKWMQMLMNEYNNKQSTNPFIALLDGYIGMRQNDNPNYQWKGLLGRAWELLQKKPKYGDLGDHGVSYDPFTPPHKLNLPLELNNGKIYKEYEGELPALQQQSNKGIPALQQPPEQRQILQTIPRRIR